VIPAGSVVQVFEFVKVFQLIEAHLADVARADPPSVATDEAFEVVAALERIRSLVDVAEAHHLAVLERRGACDEHAGLTTTAWLAHTAGISRRTAAARVRTARHLPHLPALDAAVTDGELSCDHLSAMASDLSPRVVDRVRAVEPEIVSLARELGFDRWRAEVRRLVSLLDDDGAEPVETANRLRFAATLDGVTQLDGTMTAEVAAVLTGAVEQRADDLYRRRARDHEQTDDLPIPPRDTLRMLALVELVQTALGGATGPPRAEVSLVVRDGAITDHDGQPVAPSAAGVWGCDPDLWVFVVDDLGIPLDAGHAKRFASAAQRRAVAIRDGGCVFPGCDQPISRCDTHHVRPHELGGPTDLENLAALCRHHHTVTHRPGWSMRSIGPGRFVWTNPHGRGLAGWPRPPNRAPPDSAS
jgi:hypothetical protein